MSSTRSSHWPLAAVGALALACNEPYTVDPNANAPPAVVGVIMRDSPDLDNVEDLSGNTPTNGVAGAGEAAAFYWFIQNQPTPIAKPLAIYPSQFPEIVFNKLMDGTTIEQLATDPVTGRKLGYCDPVPGAIQWFEGTTPVPNLRTCYSPADELVTVQPALPPSSPPAPPAPYVAGQPHPVDVPFLKYGETYRVALTDHIKDKNGVSAPSFSLTMNVGPFALFSVTDVAPVVQTASGPLPSGPSVSTILYGLDPAISGAQTSTLPKGTSALRLVFTGPIAPKLNPDGTVPNVSYPGLEVHQADASGTPLALVPMTFTTSDGAADRLPGTSDPRVLFGYPGSGTFASGNYVLLIPLTFSDNGSVTGSPVPLSKNTAYPAGAPIAVTFTVPS